MVLGELAFGEHTKWVTYQDPTQHNDDDAGKKPQTASIRDVDKNEYSQSDFSKLETKLKKTQDDLKEPTPAVYQILHIF